MNKKDKKSKGHREARLLIPVKEAKRLNIPTIIFWDDWIDSRDGQRDLRDRSRLRPINVNEWSLKNYHIIEDNKKLKRKERIRKMRKNKCLKD